MSDEKVENIDKVRGTYKFIIRNSAGKEGIWTVNTKSGKGTVTYNSKEPSDVTFRVHDDDAVDILTGKESPEGAWWRGKVKISGDYFLAMKLADLQWNNPEKVAAIREQYSKNKY